MTTTTPLPLTGLKVLSLTQLVQGPETGKLLGDMGADVIRIERPGSGALERHWAGANAMRDGESYLYHSVGRNQRSLAVNIATEEGRTILKRLLVDTDVLIENFRPGALAKLGLDYPSLADEFPRLVYLSATGYGSDGPYARRPGQDLLVQAASGLASVTGRFEDPPVPTGAAIVDYHASVINALSIMIALAHRDRTGKGQNVQTSLYDSALHLQSETLFYALNGWPIGERSQSGVADLTSPAPYGIYSTLDGFLAISDCPLSSLADALSIDALRSFSDEEAFTCRDQVRDLVAARTREFTTDELETILLAAGLWAGPVVDFASLPDHEQFKYRRRSVPVQTPRLGTVNQLFPPWQLSEVDVESLMRRVPPAIGADTNDVLREAGYTDAEVRLHIENGIVQAGSAGEGTE